MSSVPPAVASGQVAAVLVATGADDVELSFPSASQAVSYAVALRESAPGVRAGVHVGESTAADRFAGGPGGLHAVTEVARQLCQSAAEGEILVTRLVAGLVGRGFRIRERGRLEAGGWPVDVHEVLSGPAGGGLPLPAALDPEVTFYVGRHCELDSLVEAWRRVAQGPPRGVLVGGDAGIGKTRLAAQLAALVHEDGATVLYGDCDEDATDDYGPFVEALRDLVASRSIGEIEALPGNVGLLPLSRELRRRLTAPPARGTATHDPAADRHLTGEALVRLLASLASPVLVVVDDLQWATGPTLLLMRHLLRTAERLPLLVVGTYRETEVDRQHPLWEAMATVRKEGRLDRLDLAGLDEPASIEFVAASAGHDLDERSVDFARRLHDRTGGNPFFMQEILNHLTEAGTIYQAGGRWTADPGVTVDDLALPDSVRAVIGRRLARLSATTRHLLRVGSIAGRIFSLELLEEVVGVSERPDDVLRAVDEALEAGVLVEPGPGQLSFAHALFRQELAAELSEDARVELHQAIDEALEVLPPAHFGA